MKLAMALVALTLATAPIGAGERLKVRVSPTAATAPADVFIQTILEPASENYSMEVVAESESFYRSSLVGVDGERAPRVAVIHFSQLPAGSYDVHVSIFAKNGRSLASVTQRLSIM